MLFKYIYVNIFIEHFEGWILVIINMNILHKCVMFVLETRQQIYHLEKCITFVYLSF